MSQLSFTQKLLALVLTPVLGLIFFTLSIASGKLSTASSAKDVALLVELSAKNSALVHELQKERGLTAGFLGAANAGNDTNNLQTALQKQRTDADHALQQRADFLAKNGDSIDDSQALSLLQKADEQLNELANTRKQISAVSVATPIAIGFYTKLNSLLLDAPLTAAKETQSASNGQDLLAYYNFLQAKERAGIERAVLSNTFAADGFAPNMHRKFIALVTEQNAYSSTFLKITNSANQQLFSEAMQIPAVKEVERYRDIAFSKANDGNFNVRAIDWFNAATQRINQLKLVEDALTDQILQAAQKTTSSAYSQLTITLVLAAGIIAAVVGVSYTICDKIKRQFNTLSKAMASADSDRDLSVRAQVVSSDELGIIAKRFNNMVESIANALRLCLDSSEQLSARASDTAAAVHQNQTALKAQGMETTQIASAVVEMASSAEEVARNTNDVAITASHVGEITTSGSQLVNTTLTTMQQLGEEINVTNNHVKQLRDRSNDISSLLAVIKNVAEQTNLLALNAAIEAARAGEQGRGFAVVADEVRTLAQRTQQSTSEIENTIQLFQDSSSKASDSMQTCVAESISALENTSRLKEALTEISTAVMQLNGLTQQIACASDQQQAVSEEISRNINNVNDKALQAASGSEQILINAKDNAEQAENLKRLIGEFRLG
ncbi:methyl-accepting chemotaxis protein [Halioxenophilus aromaticivorans]|uniref:Methyl-accepting chemotaxis protein n=1 Tax=Halioxenophilus aromaticivorans TaxID=1306992 RepID=A0AAV3U415_9ALTE